MFFPERTSRRSSYQEALDAEFANTNEWWQSIPENVRPREDQLFRHLLAENDKVSYIAYVAEQNLLMDERGNPVLYRRVGEFCAHQEEGRYIVREAYTN